MQLDLKDKVVVITGGSSGIGLAAAKEFCFEGSKVIICGRSQAKLDEAKALLAKDGYDVDINSTDVSKPEEIKALADSVFEKYGRIDVWINNAGRTFTRHMLEMTPEFWDEIMHANFYSAFWGTRYAAEKMIKTGGGAIINTSSCAGTLASSRQLGYASSKAAVNMMSRTAAAELAPFNIRVNVVLPGPIRTPLMEESLNATDWVIPSRSCMQRIGDADECGKTYTFLASNAASYITGCQIEIAGGKMCVQDPPVCWEEAKRFKEEA